MPNNRRVYGAPFKAKVALAAAKGDRTTAQLASQLGVHTSQVTAWKKHLMTQVAELFADARQQRDDDARVVSFCRFTDGDRVGSTARWGSTRPCCPQTAHD